MKNKKFYYVLMERKMKVGKYKDEVVQIAYPTRRRRVTSRQFCEEVARATTYNRHEVEAVLGYAAEIAKELLANGDIVEYGELGTLMPSFKSKAVPLGKKFRPQEHIEKPTVVFRPNRKYFQLEDVGYKKTNKRARKKTEPQEEE